MALTCSHKILKAHSNEAPGYNGAVAECFVEAGQPQSERKIFFKPLHTSYRTIQSDYISFMNTDTYTWDNIT